MPRKQKPKTTDSKPVPKKGRRARENGANGLGRAAGDTPSGKRTGSPKSRGKERRQQGSQSLSAVSFPPAMAGNRPEPLKDEVVNAETNGAQADQEVIPMRRNGRARFKCDLPRSPWELAEAAGIPVPKLNPIPLRYRSVDSTTPDDGPPPVSADTPAEPSNARGADPQPERAGFRYLPDLMERAHGRDPEVMRELQHVLDTHPQLWHVLGDTNAWVTNDLVRAIAADSPFMTEAVTRKITEMRAELAGATATALIRMAVDRVIVCWLLLLRLELKAPPPEGDPTQRGDWWIKQHREADRAYQAAVQMLEKLQGRKVTELGAEISNSGAAQPTSEESDDDDKQGRGGLAVA